MTRAPTPKIESDLNEAIETLRDSGIEALLAYGDYPIALRLRLGAALREVGGALALAEELAEGSLHDGMRS